MTNELTIAGYRASGNASVFRNRTGRARLQVSGPGRAKFLHNLITQDVNHLKPGEGREAFVTSPQGKILGYISILVFDDRIMVRTEPESASLILPHLQKYGVFDEVTIEDVSPRSFEYHIAGPHTGQVLRRAGGEPPAPGDLGHHLSLLGGVGVRVVREHLVGLDGLTLIADADQADAVSEAIFKAGATFGLTTLDDDAFEALRIEWGTPAAGRDVTPDNLPQEVARDDRAINFVKGCYLGQETVARIDALGHVNKLLRGLKIPGNQAPAPGTTMASDGKVVGTITTAAVLPGLARIVALGYVRTAHSAPGTLVTVATSGGLVEAVVCELPMTPG